MLVAGVRNGNVVNVVMVVTVFVRVAIFCFRSAIVKCMLFYGGGGIGGVVVEVGMMTW